MKLLLIPLKLFLLISFLSCDNSVDPPEDQPGRRDYVWTLDTLQTDEGNMFLFGIWGSSASDVWAAGDAYVNRHTIWHFNGIGWKNYIPPAFVSPSAIYGFTSNNIWLASRDQWFWNFDGNSWQRFSEYKLDGYFHIIIQSICGRTPNDIYAVGFADQIDLNGHKAVIFHFDGKSWSNVDIPEIKTSFITISFQKSSQKYFIEARTNDQNRYRRIYLFMEKQLKEIYSGPDPVVINVIDDEVYIRIGNNVYTYENSLIKFPDISYPGIGRIYGRNKKDIFIEKLDGIDHYNGSDVRSIFKEHSIDWDLNTATIFEKDIFFIYRNTLTGKTISVHGKLK